MTRETKVGLLVGLGIILLIGIVVSDHLSVAQHQSAPDLTHFANQSQQSVTSTPAVRQSKRPEHDVARRPASNPASPRRVQPSGALGVQRAKPLPLPARVPSTPSNGRSGRPQPEKRAVTPPNRYAMRSTPSVPTLSQTGQTANQARVTAARSPVSVPQPVIHYVKAGESLWQIAQTYYDNGEYWRGIAKANAKAVGKNGSVRSGVRLVIPSKGALAQLSSSAEKVVKKIVGDQKAAAASGTRQVISRLPAKTYTVRANDSLSKIAAKTLGDPNRWEDIYKANRHLLDHPDNLQAGQRLKIPGH